MNKETSQSEQPTRAEVISALLENALIVPQTEDESAEDQREEPAWLKNANKHGYRHDICKELAALLASPTDIEQDGLSGLSFSPVLTDTARKNIVDELVKAAPLPESHEEQIKEVLRLSRIHSLEKEPYFFDIKREEDKKEDALKTKLTSLLEEELVNQIKEERSRVATEFLIPIWEDFVY